MIVAGGSLNAAADTDATIGHLVRLLSPGGWLVITEPTTEQHWVLASQAFMLAEPRNRRTGTFLSHEQWMDVLTEAGLRPVVDLPEPGHPLDPLGHRILVAQAKTDRMPLSPAAVAATVAPLPVDVTVHDHLPDNQRGTSECAE
ncbi:hypothetical protein EDC02_2347 [Micromonospora sp. Llam0]|nr:class I SAM-dependent methyltransferase [Micromonospora sp. Llam0]ROO60467.1 hypothetical protein EDC02_2347 [Micromonospora sp. Llam0]